MPYCARCGVEVDAGTEACPLCSAPIPVFDDEPDGDEVAETSDRYPQPAEPVEPLSPLQIRMAIWAVVSAVMVIGAVVLLAVNMVWTGGSLSWSGYALSSIGLAWLLTTSAILFFRRLWLVVLVDFVPILVHLAVIDLLDGSLDWFLYLGLPIATAATLTLQISAILWTVWKDRGANQVAILLLLLAVMCIGIDVVVSGHLGGIAPSWSYAVLAALVPLSGLLFIHHYVLRRIPKLRRIFHV